MNLVFLEGRVAEDAVTGVTTRGVPRLRFDLIGPADGPFGTVESGPIPIVAHGAIAQAAVLARGDRVSVIGKLQTPSRDRPAATHVHAIRLHRIAKPKGERDDHDWDE